MQHLNLNQNELLDKYIIYSATDLDGIITEASQAFCEISGYSKQELLGKPHSIVKHPDTDKKTFRQMWKTISRGGIWQGDLQNRAKDGSGYWVHARIEPLYDNTDRIYGYFAVRDNITDKIMLNKANEELYEQVNITRAILNNSKTAIATVDKEGNFIDANLYFQKKFPCLKDKKLSVLCLAELLPQHIRKGLKEEVTKALKEKGSCRFKRLDLLSNCDDENSKRIPAEIFLNLLPDRKTVVVVINFIGDKLKLKHSLKKSRTYFKKASVGFLITDRENKIIKVNPKLRDILQYKKGEIKKQPFSVLFINESSYRSFMSKVEEAFGANKNFNDIALIKQSNEKEFWAEISASKFSDDEVIKKESVFWTIKDISSQIKTQQLIQKQNEELLYLNQNLKEEVQKQVNESIRKDQAHRQEQLKNAKFSAIGQLAAGITHEINTPLTYIKGNLEMVELDIDDIADETLKNDILQQLQPIKEGLLRIGNIVDNMREISQKTKEEKIVTNIYATMVTALTVMQNRVKHIAKVYLNGRKFDLDIEKHDREFLSYAQPQRLEQVWVVMINNALDELEKIEPYEARRLDIEIFEDELNVYIRFKDNGGGIDKEVISNIFEPFIGDKSSKGMGIGLNVAKQIIEQQNGTIKAKNEKNGAMFEIKLKRYKQ